MALNQFSKNEVPYEIEEERGQLMDILLDSHQYTNNKSVAIFGDPDTVLGMAQITLEMGMIPKYVGHRNAWCSVLKEKPMLYSKNLVSKVVLLNKPVTYVELHQWIKNDPVDLLIGGTHGKQVARAEDIPLVRVGFPVIDRYVHSYMPIVGYKGAIRLAELILNALMDRQDRDCDDEDLENGNVGRVLPTLPYRPIVNLLYAHNSYSCEIKNINI